MNDLVGVFIAILFILQVSYFVISVIFKLKSRATEKFLERKKCVDCNIVEVFKETMSLLLELLDNDEQEEAKEVICDFLKEEE